MDDRSLRATLRAAAREWEPEVLEPQDAVPKTRGFAVKTTRDASREPLWKTKRAAMEAPVETYTSNGLFVNSVFPDRPAWRLGKAPVPWTPSYDELPRGSFPK
eukprot:Amastigsp_a346915_55.p2 type:complete len:103 gc:universal Amastigsp_a346915_55:88-396(+)